MNMSTNSLIMKKFIEEKLRQTRRTNVESLLTLMDQHGFYTARSRSHHRYPGGTMKHSIEVLEYALNHNTHNLPEDSIIITCLLHDLCNIKGYREIDHHGSRSVLLATKIAGFHLKDEEYKAILWHMHSTDEKGMPEDFYQTTHSPLWKLLKKADCHSYRLGH